MRAAHRRSETEGDGGVAIDERKTEAELLHRVAQGERKYYAEIVDRYKGKIYGLLRGMGIYSLRELTDMDRPLKLVLDSPVLPTEISDRIMFDPSAVSPEHPAELESEGDRFAFVGAKMNEAFGRSGLELPYTAKLANEGPRRRPKNNCLRPGYNSLAFSR